VLRQLRNSRRIPVVAAGPPLLGESSDVFTAAVTHDNVAGGFAVGCHLGALGHARVGYTAVGGVARNHSALRLQGLRAGLAANGVRDPVLLVDPVENTSAGGYCAVTSLLERYPDLTAIFAHNDRLALAALQVLWTKGRRAPEDVSVVGYQDLPMATYAVPPLTTVRIPVERIAERATELLFQALAGKEIQERAVVIQPELVVRRSTAPPRRPVGNDRR
jgi:LacI family transcriptional regulator